MNITKQQTDALNAVITIDIEKLDYAEKIDKTLNDYRKNASIPGFRKGYVPMSIIKNRYEKAIVLDEINKIIQQSLHKYINEEKMDLLGNPIPVSKNNIDWEAGNFSFGFEVGLTPEFSVNWNIKNVTQYKIVADDNSINRQVEYLRKKYGILFSKEQYETGDELTGIFHSDFEKINRKTIISQAIYNKETTKKIEKMGNLRDFFTALSLNNFIFSNNESLTNRFIGKKVNDIVTFSAKELFPKFSDLIEYFGISPDTREQDFDLYLTISEINGYQLAEINQDFFNKAFADQDITSQEQMIQKIKNDYRKELMLRLPYQEFLGFEGQALFNDVMKELIDNTQFDLPTEFLKKWIQHTSEKPLSNEQIEKEYNDLEKGYRYEIIKNKIMEENTISLTLEEFKKNLSDMFIEDLELDTYSPEQISHIERQIEQILSNAEETERLSTQLINKKIFDLFIEKTNPEIKEILYSEFVDIYKKE